MALPGSDFCGSWAWQGFSRSVDRNLDNTTKDPAEDQEPPASQNGPSGRSRAQVPLLVYSIEKVVQHLFVSYAFVVDLGEIRDTVVIHHLRLTIIGFAVGLLFAVSARFQFRNERAGYRHYDG